VTEREDQAPKGDDEIVIVEGRVAGCRGRVLIALLVLAILFALLLFMLVRGLLTETPPLPVPQAAASPSHATSHAGTWQA
jgi:hypothetical protein